MVQIIIIALYFVLIFYITYLMSKQNKSMADYITASSSFGIFAIIPMVLSEVIAGSATIGAAATGYSTGLSAGWSLWGMAIGCLLAVIFATKFYRVMACKGKMSVGESFAYYFDERCRIVMVFITITFCIIMFSLQPAAAAAIIAPLLGIDQRVCAWVIAAFFTVTAMLGGIKGVAKVNFIHSLVMYIGIAMTAYFSLRFAGGIAGLKENLPTTHFDLIQPSLFTVSAWVLGASINVPAGAMVSGAILTSKSVKTANRALIITAALMVPFALCCAVIGMSAKASGLTIMENNAIFTMANQISPILSGIASMAILAAILSSAPALLVLIGGTVTRDIYVNFINKQATERQQTYCSKITIIAFGVIGMLMGGLPGSLLSKALGAFQIRSSAGLVLILALVIKKVNNHAAFWSMLFGGASAIIWFFMGNPFGIEPVWPSLGIALIILFGFLIFTKEPEYEGHKILMKDYEDLKDIL